MKNINIVTFSPQRKSANKLTLILIALILFLGLTSVSAQDTKYSKPKWWFGVAAGANFNFYRGSTQQLNADFTPPTAFHNGFGTGLYLAPAIEYHIPNSRFGFMLQAGYDNRNGKFNQVITPCNCPADLNTKLSYITIEPSLRFAPFNGNFYVYGGPRIAFNQSKKFEYQLGKNPNFPMQATSPPVKGDLSDVKNTVLSMQIGMGYDVPINSETAKTQWVVSPFVAYQPYFGQNPRATETWNVSTLRAGVILKFGQGHPLESAGQGEAQLTVTAPAQQTTGRKVREVFPIRNYVFFDAGSSEISNRYILLNKNQVADFKEDQIAFDTPKNMSGRSERQMIVYYNILNILGDRMGKNPSSTITLVGSSDRGIDDGRVMAQSIKNYLINVFSINGNRIAIEGRIKPVIASEQPGGTLELALLREGDRRVSIESSSPALLMEFQSGPDAPLKPIEIISMEQAANSDAVVFDTSSSKEKLNSWSVALKDSRGKSKNYGPYTQQKVSIPVKTILGNQPEGDYQVALAGTTADGKTVTTQTTVHVVPYVAPVVQESIRFSVLYEFNESKSIAIYQKYLTDIVTPKIKNGNIVIITGHTDIIGETEYNKNLSLARANDVKGILVKSLAAAGTTNVTFDIHGDGEDENLAPFENKYPEERFYNRTVVIDILDKK
ncbi:OmpA family protein [Flavobacterium sp.]|uniref:OmpA family protein n=1 Tax=Flavobacterium sp. TaxID=239 RepID=UPI0025F20A23|nr:OmpA family protein [Flavobacterium sp.]